jgi:hypothetical protein
VPRTAGDAAVREHLCGADPVLAGLLERHDVLLVEDDDTEREHYAALVRGDTVTSDTERGDHAVF